jgi:hypothetical protein
MTRGISRIVSDERKAFIKGVGLAVVQVGFVPNVAGDDF